MVEITAMTYEQVRSKYFEEQMQKAQRRMKYWEARIDRTRPDNLMDEAHGKAADAGWEYNFYKDALEALAAQPKWISVEDRLPDEPGEVMICLHGYVTVAWYSVNRFETGGGMVFFVDDHFADGNEVTHWMPLPSKPEEV